MYIMVNQVSNESSQRVCVVVKYSKRFDQIDDVGRKKHFDQLFDTHTALLCTASFHLEPNTFIVSLYSLNII